MLESADTLFNIAFQVNFFIKCLVAVLLGGFIGLERELKNKPAGFKTHVLICLGATVLTFLSSRFSPTGDPGRIAAQIISGIGFIGAGTIIHSRQVIQGLTTAATLWVVASIGMLVGAGYFILAILVTILVVLFMLILNALFTLKFSRDRYCLSVEVFKLQSIEKIDDLIRKFDLDVEEKKLVRSKGVFLDIHYFAPPLVQHIFMKRLFQIGGLGKIVKI
ncbi:MgtC/SapB family protein [Candidatus Margulisiibacteriota bacterium]